MQIAGVVQKDFIIESFIKMVKFVRSAPPLLARAVREMWTVRANMSNEEFRRHMEVIRDRAIARLFQPREEAN